MNNEITVTRAPRICGWEDLRMKSSYYLARFSSASDATYYRIATNFDGPSKTVSNGFHLPFAIPDNMFIPLGDFDAMCKWVANGRKLEDLQGDGRDEWARMGDLPAGQYFTMLDYRLVGPSSEDREYTQERIPRRLCKIVLDPEKSLHRLVLEEGVDTWHDADMYASELVWPLGPGDSITITPKP